MGAEIGLLEIVADGSAWVVLDGLDGVDPPGLLLGELFRPERGPGQAIDGDLHEPGEVLGQAFGADLEVFVRGRKVERGAHEVQGLGNGVGVHPGRALEQELGCEAGRALGRRGLERGAGPADEHPEADERHVRVLEIIDRDPVPEDDLLRRRESERGASGGRSQEQEYQSGGQEVPPFHFAPPSGTSFPTVLLFSVKYRAAAARTWSLPTAA